MTGRQIPREVLMTYILAFADVSLPHPFGEGDVLRVFDDDFYPYGESPMVFEKVITDSEEGERISPMTAKCRYISENGEIKEVCKYKYTDLEYCDRKDDISRKSNIPIDKSPKSL